MCLNFHPSKPLNLGHSSSSHPIVVRWILGLDLVPSADLVDNVNPSVPTMRTYVRSGTMSLLPAVSLVLMALASILSRGVMWRPAPDAWKMTMWAVMVKELMAPAMRLSPIVTKD